MPSPLYGYRITRSQPVRLVEGDTTPGHIELEWDRDQVADGLDDTSALFGPDEQQHEPAAAGTEQLAADRPGARRRLVERIHFGIRHAIGEPALQPPRLVEQPAELDDVGGRGEQLDGPV